jgi:CDP-glucose 4,6-dehydratase
VRDAEHLGKVIQESKPEMIFHLAAQPLVRLSYQEPRMTFETNVMGSVNILEALRQAQSVRTCVIVTSDKCYDNKEWVYAYRENDPLGGYDPYSSSKACTELVVAAYRNSFFLNENTKYKTALSTVRAGNVIGGGDWAADRIVPDTIQALARGAQVPVRSPHAIRPWQHVLEPLAGYLWLSSVMWQDGQKNSAAWNFGPDDTSNITVRDLVKKIIGRWGSGSWLDLSEGSKNEPHEAKFLKLDCTRAHNLLQWYPVYDISETVNVTADWYRQYYSDNSANIFLLTLRQIEAYIEKARQSGAVWA